MIQVRCWALPIPLSRKFGVSCAFTTGKEYICQCVTEWFLRIRSKPQMSTAGHWHCTGGVSVASRRGTLSQVQPQNFAVTSLPLSERDRAINHPGKSEIVNYGCAGAPLPRSAFSTRTESLRS